MPTYPISKYRSVHKRSEKTEENVINLRGGQRAFRYVAYAAKLLFDGKHKVVYLHATGLAVSKVIQTVETLRNRINNLHAAYEIKTAEFQDEYHPTEEGLEVVIIKRQIHAIHATLVIGDASSINKGIGYLKPHEKVFDEEGFKKKVAEHFERTKERNENRAKQIEERKAKREARLKEQGEGAKESPKERKPRAEQKGEQRPRGQRSNGQRGNSTRKPPRRDNDDHERKRRPQDEQRQRKDGDDGRRPQQQPRKEKAPRNNDFDDERKGRGEGNFRDSKPQRSNNDRPPRREPRDDYYDQPPRDREQNNRRQQSRGKYRGDDRNYRNDRYDQQDRYDNRPPRKDHHDNYDDEQPSRGPRNQGGRTYARFQEERAQRNYDNIGQNRSDSRGRSWRHQSRDDHNQQEDSRRPNNNSSNSGNFRGNNDQPFKSRPVQQRDAPRKESNRNEGDNSTKAAKFRERPVNN